MHSAFSNVIDNIIVLASLAQRMSVHTGAVTPPKSSDSTASLQIASSTPISNVNNNKSKPTASSTPNVGGLKSYREKIQAQQNSKNLLNVAPKSMNSSLKETINGPKSNNKRFLIFSKFNEK